MVPNHGAAVSFVSLLKNPLGCIKNRKNSRCESAAGQDIDRKDGINTKNFYIELGTAQFGVWGSFAVWVGLTVCAIIKLLRYHQLENIRVSMYRERQRLINENADSPGSSLGRESTTTQSTATAEWSTHGAQGILHYPYVLIYAIIHITLFLQHTVYKLISIF